MEEGKVFKTKIMSCKCEHEKQDKMYGKGRRVANYSVKQKMFRCTVCGEFIKT